MNKIGASSLSQSLTNLARARFTITLTHRFGFRQAVAANSRALEAMSDTPVTRARATPSNLYLQCILRLANESGPGMLQARRLGAAICVQRFDDSLNPAIHITYRVSRRSSSLREPRDPSLKGVLVKFCLKSVPSVGSSGVG